MMSQEEEDTARRKSFRRQRTDSRDHVEAIVASCQASSTEGARGK